MDDLEANVIATVLGYLCWKDILKARVCRKWKEAATITSVPETTTKRGSWEVQELFVKDRDFGLALHWISVALPRIPVVNFDFSLGASKKFEIADGPDAELTLQIDIPGYHPEPPVDLAPLANFRDLRHLYLSQTSLNGRYPFLFNFPRLETLDLLWNTKLKWDLEMLAELPCLKKLSAVQNHSLTGKLRSVRTLCLCLIELNLFNCDQVEGCLSDVADFPLLEKLNVDGTKVTGDIREIGPNDFFAVKELCLGSGVYGGGDLERIQDAPDVMLARYYLKKRTPSLFEHRRWSLSQESPERYEIHGHHSREPPFHVEFVKAGPRLGWRWTNCVGGGSCEAHWLDVEPSPSDEQYGEYLKELQRIENDVGFYQGFSIPPTMGEHEERSAEIPLDPMLARYSSPSCFGVW